MEPHRATGTSETVEMPDLSGRSVRDASLVLAQMGLTSTLSGRGAIVASQDPPPGAEVSPGSACTLSLSEGTTP